MGRKKLVPIYPDRFTEREKNRIAVNKYKDKNREVHREYCRKYRETHKEYFKQKKKEERERIKNDPSYRAQEFARVKRNYQKNREKIIARQKAYADSHVEELKAYRKKNVERRGKTSREWRKNNLDHFKAVRKAWEKENMHIIRMHIALYRARKINATIGDPREIAAWEKEWKARPANICEWCRMETPTENCHSDHAEPLSLGGSHNLSNLVIACRSCNSRKKDKPLEKWLAILGRG